MTRRKDKISYRNRQNSTNSVSGRKHEAYKRDYRFARFQTVLVQKSRSLGVAMRRKPVGDLKGVEKTSHHSTSKLTHIELQKALNLFSSII
jgi:hypothetical protein